MGQGLASALAIAAALEAGLLGVLLLALRRRRRAGASACRRLAEIARLSSAGATRELARWLVGAMGTSLASALNDLAAARRLLLREAPPLDEVAAALDEAQAAGERVAGVVRQLRAVLPADGGRVPLDANEVVREALRLVRGVCGRHETVTSTLSPLPPVRGDRRELVLVVLEMVLDALESASSSRRGPVVVRTRSAGDSIELWVDESSEGAAGPDRARLLAPFLAKDLMGLGAGLAAARSIVESYGGRITAERSSGGARFRITLPVGPAGAVHAEARLDPAIHAPGATKV